jgi:hypothetical protein
VLIRKSDQAEFGVEWFQATFDKLIERLECLLVRLYRGKVFEHLEMEWRTGRNAGNRQELSPDEKAVDFLGLQWHLDQAPESDCIEFARLLGE